MIAEGKDFKILKVKQVIENSPATDADLRAGDVILALNDRPVVKLTLEQVRRMFRKEGSYLLSIARGDEKMHVRIRLRRLI